jgi:NDP-sugar pyrophosphorylase family protein
VDEQAEVINSVLMANVSVGYHSIVDSCIIDEGVKIGRLCYIGFGKSVRLGNHDITVLGKSAVVPSHTAIGYNCTVMPHVDASSFAGNMIAPGSILLPRVTARNTNEKAVQDERESVRVA